MATKGAKETLVNKLGFKSNSSKSVDMEMEKLKRENQQLKKSLEDMKRAGRHQHTHPDTDKAKLLERILSLETQRERNCQQLLVKDQEVCVLRQQLRSAHGEVVSSLQNQLQEKQQEAEQREKQIQALSKETEDLKNKYCVVSERCDTLEKQKVSSGELATVQEQLRDALEKNHNWLVYDQQREAYVQGVLAKTKEFEMQLNEANKALQQQHKEASSDGQSAQDAQRELEAERARVSHLQAEVKDLRGRYEEKSREAAQAWEQLLEEKKRDRETLQEERRCSSERTARLHAELEDERKRVAELLMQVNRMQKSLMNQQEEQKRIAILEQQILLSAKESENEKVDRQTLQHQLHKVLKELRKARDQITRLESSKQQRESRFSEPSSCNRMDFERLTIQDRTTSPSKVHNMLDESMLECPNCGASYPTSQHRELLAHLDYCFR
ncbi:centrosomal protein of 55 kDa-like [Pimephales promelas]|uniref:centrosomal protein of 55 kDa-like n=1 Tax=Pimephales promelas TaxID=90988 RepID=UPI0019559023|nr:centrosomal protein of 55 kDa-like [Pimephales promelas]XP_039520665.1 centrosomal protein of 55 kDa-like [Pimephales promelas]KAG1954603.1 centrosomal protein of 55 kDa [Pimephales promelas]